MEKSKPRYRVTVIDDSPENLNLISSILATDYEVRCSRDSVHAVEFIERSEPDVILLDAIMPLKDGFTVLQEIRQHPSVREIPVIFLTALIEDRDEQRALELGAVDFIRKPFNPVIVRARLKIHLDLLNERRTVEDLLANMLPRKVINDLRTKGESVPELVPSASLVFTDFVRFTSRVAELHPRDVINELTDMFTVFDEITLRHGGTRIKTIGDAYFAACGVESHMANHADSAIQIALDITEYVRKRPPFNGHKWEIRSGICSGAVTAGIVGSTKYLYDVFGDAVNVASRVEGSCDPMHVSSCKSTIDQCTLRNLTVTSRGLISVKGRGELELFYISR